MDPDSSLALLGHAFQLVSSAPLLALLGPIGLALHFAALVVLLGLSALFSGSEVALFTLASSANPELEEESSGSAKRVQWLLQRPRSLLITILILNTLVNVGAAILAAVITIDIAHGLGWSEAIVLVLEVVVLTFVLLVVSEVAPKLMASRNPLSFAKRTSLLIYPMARILSPISSVMAKGTMRLQERMHKPADPLSPEDVRTMADVGEAQGSLQEEERALIHSILEFGETTVREVMISRVDMVSLPETATLDEALEAIRDSGHSRIPMFREHLDNVIGLVYAKDLLPFLGRNEDAAENPINWESMVRQPRFVPLSKKLDDMLEDFQEHSTHMAIVVDEYGGTAGLVTLEDLLEEVVGEIWDEMDTPEEVLIQAQGPNTWKVQARIDLDDLAEKLDVELDTSEFDFETLGGLVFDQMGEVPEPGDEVSYERLDLEVLRVEENRITEVQVTLQPEDSPEENKE